MAIIEIDRKPSRRSLVVFGCLLAAVVGGVGAWLRFGAGHETAATVVWIAGGALLLAYAAVPRLRRPIYVGWILLFFPLGWVLSHVVLALVYYLVLTPIGLIRRVVGKDPLCRRLEPEAETYWVEREEPADDSQYFRQF